MTYLDSAAPAPMTDIAMMDGESMPTDEGMGDDEFQSLVSREIEDAINFIDTDLAPTWENATLYYRGALFGDEQEGRSKVVSRDVHDTVNAILPSLMRVFFGSDKVVEFMPQGPEDVGAAEQATDYINYIVTRDNPGFSVFWDAFKDALVRKHGWVKFYWDNSLTPSTVTYTGLEPMTLMLLAEKLAAEAQGNGEYVQFGEPKQDANGITITVKTLKPIDKARIVSVPNEEVIVDRRATSDQPGCFTYIGHRTLKTKSQLIAMGYTDEELSNIGADDGSLRENQVRQARLPIPGQSTASATNNDSQQEFLYIEGFLYADKDGDGIAELHKVCSAGSNYRVLHTEQVDDHNLACFPCDPEPHAFFGDSIAEKTMDIQKIKSGVLRASLDSLAQSIFPRTVVSRSGVEIADVLNTEVGAIIRADNPSLVQTLDTPFVGKDAFPMLAYMDEVRENRTGMSKVAQGLDPGALQNTTALAAANQFNKAHEHIEIIARIFAETGMKRLFRGLLRLVGENQRKARVVNLRNQWVEVDPRSWRTNMDVTCNVALGAGTSKDRLQVIAGVLAKQELQIQMAGAEGPMVGLAEYHNALRDFLALSGEKNVEKYFRSPDPNYQAPEPPPDPKLMIEQMKIQAATAQADADRQADMMIRLAEINARYQTTIDAATIKAQADVLRINADLAIQASEARNRPAKEAAAA